MKVILDIKDNKALHLLEILRSLPFVKTTLLSDPKARYLSELKEAIAELNDYKSGKIDIQNAEDFLNEI